MKHILEKTVLFYGVIVRTFRMTLVFERKLILIRIALLPKQTSRNLDVDQKYLFDIINYYIINN